MEIERKHKLDAENFDGVKARLFELGFAPKKTKHQIDIYYLLAGQSDSETHFMTGSECTYLRRRHDVIAGTFSLDLKLVNEEKRSGIFGEYEVAISNETSFSNADEILKILGYKQGCIIDKAREAWVKGDVEVALDNVAGLGLFVEVEIVADEAAAKDALVRVDEICAALGFNASTLMPTGYVDLVAWKKVGRKF
ncbi:MAG: class IV adenylate cyclase [Rickettsiales bacterium]|nr:class IV adenylate cyclase [Rickettsiales bacterium]